MKFTIQEFPEMERFFLLELSYFDFQKLDLGSASFFQPIPVSELAAALDQAENSARGRIPEYKAYKERELRRLHMIFNESSFLHDMKLVGYINDNEGIYGTTKNFRKSGLVAQAYSDLDGNIFFTYRGMESMSMISMLRDLICQMLPYMGIASIQFQRAYSFFEEIAAKTTGNLIVAGDRFGGSLALYIYIKEKEKKQEMRLSGIAVNAKKTALLWKTLNIEKYLTTENFIFKRNVKKEIQKGIIEDMLSDIESEHQRERDGFYQEVEDCLKRLESGQIINCYDALYILMEKLKKYTYADALILWFRHEDKNGPYIIPYIMQGQIVQGLKHLKLREGEAFISSSAFLGIGKLFPDLEDIGVFSSDISKSNCESMICMPVTSEKKTIGAIQMSKFGSYRKFNESTYQQVLAFTKYLDKYLTLFEQEIFYDNDDYFIQIFDRTIKKPIFSILEFENKMMTFLGKSAYEGMIKRLTGQSLEAGEVLKYQRKCYTKENVEDFKNVMRKDIGILFKEEYRAEDKLFVLMQPYLETKREQEYAVKLNEMLHFSDFEQTPFCELTRKEKLIFHTAMAVIKRPKFMIICPCMYSLEEGLRTWTDSMLRVLAADQNITVLRFQLHD